MNFTRRLGPALATLALVCGATTAMASNPSRDVLTRSAPETRTDVRTACAGMEQQLQERLAQLRQRTGLRDDVTVHFVLDGNEVRDVAVTGAAPMDARMAVRRAVRDLSCNDGAARQAPQAFSFVLSVTDRPEPAPAFTPAASNGIQLGLAPQQ